MPANPSPPDVPLLLIGGIAAYLLAANLLAYLAFALDKGRAVRREWRIPETTLLTLALLGGWPGAKLAQLRHRHKTRKQPFRTRLNLSGLVLPMAVLGAVLLVQRPMAPAVVADLYSVAMQGIGQSDDSRGESAAFRPKGAGKWQSAPPKP